ncbi:MAG: Dihydrolipoamide dehydrogenasecomponent of pyruvate/2-oxoglutarate dehydrogenase complex [Candidatus Alkanophagales archaeon MCA70_species_2]|nr:Dihydrolipoamide dehydrogenasecomponent of pyruvate/2-oxoglutarate dehydrogenase complex [Candidatus Alkanophaga liquidiphilum]
MEGSLVECAVSLDLMEKMGLCEEFGLKKPKFVEILRKIKEMREKMQGFFRVQNKMLGIEYVEGEAELLDPKTVEVDGEKLKAENIVIATGSRPKIPNIKGNDLQGVITYREVLDLKRLPEKLVIIGGGSIAAAYGYAFRIFGSEVTILEKHRFLSALDKDLRKYAKSQLESRGVRVLEGVDVVEISGGSEVNSVLAEVRGGIEEFPADAVLLAIGLTPNSEIERKMGVKIEKNNEIIVDKRMRTSVEGVYAVGDVTGPPYLTPVARREGIVAASNIMGRDMEMSYDFVPMSVLMGIELSWVGTTEEEARKNHEVDVLMNPGGVVCTMGFQTSKDSFSTILKILLRLGKALSKLLILALSIRSFTLMSCSLRTFMIVFRRNFLNSRPSPNLLLVLSTSIGIPSSISTSLAMSSSMHLISPSTAV